MLNSGTTRAQDERNDATGRREVLALDGAAVVGRHGSGLPYRGCAVGQLTALNVHPLAHAAHAALGRVKADASAECPDMTDRAATRLDISALRHERVLGGLAHLGCFAGSPIKFVSDLLMGNRHGSGRLSGGSRNFGEVFPDQSDGVQPRVGRLASTDLPDRCERSSRLLAQALDLRP